MKKYWILITAIILIIIGLFLNSFYGNVYDIFGLHIKYFAAGDYAMGVFAAGRFSIGIFSAGIFSVGVFSIGIFNIGLYAIGFFLLAWKKQYPMIAGLKDKLGLKSSES